MFNIWLTFGLYPWGLERICIRELQWLLTQLISMLETDTVLTLDHQLDTCK